MKHIIFILCIFASICASAQTLFKPKSATIQDAQGSYTSQSFDCGNMVVNDYSSLIKVSVSGDTYTLNRSATNNDTYLFSQHKGNNKVELVAYRSSSSKKIYLVTLKIKWLNENRSITISFKP